MTLDVLFRKMGVVNFTRDFHQERPQVMVEFTVNNQPYIFYGYHDLEVWLKKNLPEKVVAKILICDFEPGIGIIFACEGQEYLISVNTVKTKNYRKMP